jgi:UPF0755 protein
MTTLQKMLIAGLALLGALGVVIGAGAWWLFAPVQPNATESVRVEVARGSGQTRLANQLTEQQLIRHPLSFRLAVRLLGLGQNLQAGVYQVSASENAFEIARRLTRNTSDIRVTLPEGLRAEEVVESLTAQLGSTATSSAQCNDQNGYLFPNTYSFVPGTSIESACARLRGQFDTQWQSLSTQYDLPDSYTQEELVILASLVQREAKDAEDMRKVAGVLFNRLEMGMPLQIDATLQYAKGFDAKQKTWWPTPLAADKNIKSPYNTYANAGLPAGPISNPGNDALRAVLTPVITDDLYYISTLDGTEMYFAPTYEEHQVNIERYLR